MVLSPFYAYFYVSYSLLALELSSVGILPCYLVARRELTEEAAHLHAKPPVKGSKDLGADLATS